MLEERTRQWIEDIHFGYYGLPIHALEVFRGGYKKIRSEYPKFDEFLKKLGELLKRENNDDYKNIIRFINIDITIKEVNWISTNKSLLNILVKLYNLCLSPNQALEYIKRCHEVYQKMINSNYHLHKLFLTDIEVCKNSRKEKTIDCYMISDKETASDDTFEFKIHINDTFRVMERYYDSSLSIDENIHLIKKKNIQEDTLEFFVYYQDKEYLSNIINKAIEELKEYKVLTIEKDTNNLEIIRIMLPVGRYDLSK